MQPFEFAMRFTAASLGTTIKYGKNNLIEARGAVAAGIATPAQQQMVSALLENIFDAVLGE